MARPNPIVQLRNIRDTLRHYGYANPVRVVEDADSNGNPAILLDYSAGTWATLNKRVIVRAIGNPLGFPNTALTPSVDGSVGTGVFSFDLVVEDSGAISASAAEHRKFIEDVIHVLRGNMQNSVSLSATAKGTEPTVQGVNGAGSSAAVTVIGTLIPGGRVVSPGFSS